MKTSKIISTVTAGLVLFLAGSAFILSFDALHGLARDNGIKPGLAWLWPLGLDAFMVAASLSVLRASLNREATIYPWALVVVFTLASVAFNVVHAEHSLLAQAIAAVPPVVVFLSFELLMGQSKNEVARSALAEALETLNANVQERQADLDALNAALNKLGTRKADLERSILELREQQRTADAFNLGNLDGANEARAESKREAVNALLAFLNANPNATLNEAGEAIGRAKSTVSNYVNELVQEGRLHKNGQGWEVL